MRPRHAGPSESHRIRPWPSLLRNQVTYKLYKRPTASSPLVNSSLVVSSLQSVLTYYGVNSVFENAIRAALVSRRAQRFWLAGFKRVQRPLLQVSVETKTERDFIIELTQCSFIRLHFAHPSRATLTCTSRPAPTTRTSKRSLRAR